jgi:predicted unusual protein kinase regulating ubiquinone biosynthesis (AarF/ABC1/UbiB family)
MGAMGMWQLRRHQHDAVRLAVADSRLDEMEAPTLPEPSEFHHPYEARPWLWRVWFSVRRVVFVVLNLCPIIANGIVDYMFTNTTYAAETRERFLTSIVSALERGGCTALKFGQWISMRPDLFPSDIVERLACLRDSAPQHSMEQTRATIAHSFGRQIEEIFEEFGAEPVASGSIAQVYKARLLPQFALPGGAQDVADKVRLPTVMDESFVDMETLFGAWNGRKCAVSV